MDSGDAGRSDDAGLSGVAMIDGESSGRDGRRPGWAGLFWATVVVLVVGGFALSRSHGVQEVSSGTLPPLPPVPWFSTTSSSPVTIDRSSPVYGEWMYQVTEAEFGPDNNDNLGGWFEDFRGSLYVAAPVGVARLDGAGGWTLIDVEGLPIGAGLEDGLAGRIFDQIAIGSDGVLWVSGTAWSHVDDEQFGGFVDWFVGLRSLSWVARLDGCRGPCSWTVFTTNEVPELEGGIGDMVVLEDGTLYASAGEDLLLVFDGAEWESHPLPSAWVQGLPGSRSSAVPFYWFDSDGVWSIYSDGSVSFDGDTRHTIYPSPFVRPVGSFTFTPVQWGIDFDDPDWGPGVYTVFMHVDARPLTASLVEDVSGRLIWDETVVDLCNITIRQEGIGFLHIGDIFQTTEGCGSNPTAMQDAFDWFGLPEAACVTVTVGGVAHEYCAPLLFPGSISVGSEPGTVTVSLDGLEGFERLAVDAWVVPLEPTDARQRLGGTSFWPINQDPVFASDVIHPQGESYFDFTDGETATFEPGTYRFIIEAYVPSGNMRYGCEMPIQVVEGEPLVVTFTSIPTYTGGGIHWTPLDELEYPDCPK